LNDANVRISMDGRGRWMDNVFIERLWRSLKYECVYLNAFETGSEARTGIGRWLREHLGAVVAIMKLSVDWHDFRTKLDKLYPRVGKPTQLSLEFADDAETDTGTGL
jgi:transposase InsO family protein